MGIAAWKAKRAAEQAALAVLPDYGVRAVEAFTSPETGISYHAGDYVERDDMSQTLESSLNTNGLTSRVNRYLTATIVPSHWATSGEKKTLCGYLPVGNIITGLTFNVTTAFAKEGSVVKLQVRTGESTYVDLFANVNVTTTGSKSLTSPLYYAHPETDPEGHQDLELYIVTNSTGSGANADGVATLLINQQIYELLELTGIDSGDFKNSAVTIVDMGDIPANWQAIRVDWEGDGLTHFGSAQEMSVVIGTVEDPDVIADASFCELDNASVDSSDILSSPIQARYDRVKQINATLSRRNYTVITKTLAAADFLVAGKTVSLGTIPAGQMACFLQLDVTGFTALSAPTLKIGTALDDDLVLVETDLQIATGVYYYQDATIAKDFVPLPVEADTELIATLGSTTLPEAGQVVVYIYCDEYETITLEVDETDFSEAGNAIDVGPIPEFYTCPLVTIDITEVFDGTSPEINLGVTGDPDLFANNVAIDEKTAEATSLYPADDADAEGAAEDAVQVVFTGTHASGDAPTQGGATITAYLVPYLLGHYLGHTGDGMTSGDFDARIYCVDSLRNE